MWSTSHLDALGDRLNQDKSGFLRMVNRSSRLNASSYSLSSLFSVGSVNCGSTISGVSRGGAGGGGGPLRTSSKRNVGPLWQGPSSLKALYKLLLEPMEDDLPEGYPCELVLVLEGDLLLVPFAMLKVGCWCLGQALISSTSLRAKKNYCQNFDFLTDRAFVIVEKSGVKCMPDLISCLLL